MAFTFPLSVGQFASLLFIEDAVFTPARNDEITGMGSLSPLHAKLASPLWAVDLKTMPLDNDQAESVATMLEVLSEPGRDFYISNPRKLAPKMDPDGSILDGAVITIASVETNNHQLSLTGFPEDYVISRSDMFAFEYGPSEQKRRAYHRFAEDGITTSMGNLGPIEVFPHILPGATAGDVVTIVGAAMRAKIVPGSYRPQGYGGGHEVLTFRAIQKLI